MKEIIFRYQVLKDSNELNKEDALLLEQARKLTQVSHAPYSLFHVACVAKLSNGQTIPGTNQESASFPVGICAERSLLAALGTLFPNEPIETIAVTYNAINGNSNKPISPCGMCRQALAEYEQRAKKPMRLILSGMEGAVYIINTAKDLLPLAFSDGDLK